MQGRSGAGSDQKKRENRILASRLLRAAHPATTEPAEYHPPFVLTPDPTPVHAAAAEETRTTGDGEKRTSLATCRKPRERQTLAVDAFCGMVILAFLQAAVSVVCHDSHQLQRPCVYVGLLVIPSPWWLKDRLSSLPLSLSPLPFICPSHLHRFYV